MNSNGDGEGSSRCHSSNISILLVDDDITTLHIVSAMLKTWSYEVVTAPNPHDALALLRNGHPFDLVVTDLHMPQMNGLELQKLVHEEFDLPVIMMSSDDKETAIMKSLEEGCVYYIVKPVSKEDIQMVWKFVLQSKQRRSSDVTFEDIMNIRFPEGFSPGELMFGLDELDDLDSISLNNEDDRRKGNRKTGKRDKNEDDEDRQRERRLYAKGKSKMMWGNALHTHFLLVVKHLGFDKAVPKRIHELMNVPGLTRENVASHLQKYRTYLRRTAEKARLSKCLNEKIKRAGLPFGIPSLDDNHGAQYVEYLKQQIHMNQMGLIAPPSQNSLANLGDNSSSFQPLALNLVENHSQNDHQLCGGSGKSRLLMNNPIQNQRNSMQVCNNQGSGFGMQMMNYNGGNGIMSNNGANLMDIDAQQGQCKQLQKALNFTSNPFTYGNTSVVSSSSNSNVMMSSPMNNAAFEPSFNGATGQPTGVFGNVMNGGYNGMGINNDEMTDIMNGVRNASLNGANFSAPTTGNIGSNASSSRFETGDANPFAPRGFQPMLNSSLLLPPNGMQQNQYGITSSSTSGVGNGGDDIDFLRRNSMRNYNHVSLASEKDDMMVINNLVMQQLDNTQLPSQQKKGRKEAPVALSSMEYQDNFLASKATTTNARVHLNPNRASYGLAFQSPSHLSNSPFQLNPNRGAYGLAQQNPNHLSNTSFQLNPNRAAYGGLAQQNLNPVSNSLFQLNPNPTDPYGLARQNLNHVGNTQDHLNPNPSVNGELHQRLNSMANPFANIQVQLNPPSSPTVHFHRQLSSNPNDVVDLYPDRFLNTLDFGLAAPNQSGVQINPNANQGGNTNLFRFENAPNAEQSWILGGQGSNNPHILNSSDYNMFQSDGSSNQLDQQFASQDLDDDLVSELMRYGGSY